MDESAAHFAGLTLLGSVGWPSWRWCRLMFVECVKMFIAMGTIKKPVTGLFDEDLAFFGLLLLETA